MKKIISLALILCLVISLAFTGCTFNFTSANAKMQEYVDEINQSLSAANTDDMKMEYSLEGKALVYTVTYSDTYASAMGDLQAALDAQESTFTASLSAAKTAGYAFTSIIIRFADTSGKVLAEKEYK